MKNIIRKVLLLTALVALTACSNTQSSQDSKESKQQDITLSTEVPSSDNSQNYLER